MAPRIISRNGAAWTATTAVNWNGIIPFGTTLAVTARSASGIASGTQATVSVVAVSSGSTVGTSEPAIVDTAQGMIAFGAVTPSALGLYQIVVTLLGANAAVLDVLTTETFGVMP